MGRLASAESFKNYLLAIINDYKTTLIELKNYGIKKPYRSTFIVSILCSGLYLFKNNPTEKCFLDQVITSHNSLITVEPSIRNPSSLKHVAFLGECLRERSIKRVDLGIMSLLFRLDMDPECSLFVNQCSHLKPSYFHLICERLIDIGIAGKYRILENKMIDFDINPDEWS